MRDINIKNVNVNDDENINDARERCKRYVVFFAVSKSRTRRLLNFRAHHSARKKKNSYDNAREKRSKRVEMTTKKKEDNDAKKGGNSYEVDAKYSFKDLVSVSPPSW